MKVDWKCIRYAQKELCIKKRMSLDEFRNAWIKYFGEPQSDQDRWFLQYGIRDFYEDYMTSTYKNVYDYFKSIESD